MIIIYWWIVSLVKWVPMTFVLCPLFCITPAVLYYAHCFVFLCRSWSLLVERGSFRWCRPLNPSCMRPHLMNWRRMKRRRKRRVGSPVIKPPSPHTLRRTRTPCSRTRREQNTRTVIGTQTAEVDILDIIKVDISRAMKVKGQGHIHIPHPLRIISTTTIIITSSRAIMEEEEGGITTPGCTTWDIPHPWGPIITQCTWACIHLPGIHCPLWWSSKGAKGHLVTSEVIILDMVQDITDRIYARIFHCHSFEPPSPPKFS